jgi:transcriptional regulator with XRE-family HTH domain
VDSTSSPTVSRRELARVLRELRHQRGYSLDQVHVGTGVDQGFLSRVERGLRGLGADKVGVLAEFYGATPEVTARLGQLASLARASSWWDRTTLPKPVRDYIGLEQAATAISIYGSFVPGILQTRPYAEATKRATDQGLVDASLAEVVDHRMRRQAVLARPDPPWLNVILDESVLHREVGGPTVLHDQITALLRAAEQPRTTVRLIEFAAGAHPGLDSRFVMLSTRETYEVDFVHVEGLSGYRNFQRPSDVARFRRAWQALSAKALSPADTLIALARVAASQQLPTARSSNLGFQADPKADHRD